MKKFLQAIKNLGLKFALNQIRSRKDQLLSNLNKKIDLPLLDEQDERELLEGIWSLFDDLLVDIENENK